MIFPTIPFFYFFLFFLLILLSFFFFFFFFNDTATTEIYTLSLHDALPILKHVVCSSSVRCKMSVCSDVGRTFKTIVLFMQEGISYMLSFVKQQKFHQIGRAHV